MRRIPQVFLIVTLILTLHECTPDGDTFSEELYIRDLQRGFVSLHFSFNTVQLSLKKSYIQHYHLFPRTIGEILYKYDVSELHLSLVRGFWDSNEWGYPHTFEAPGAAEVWAWFNPKVRHVDQTWKSLTNALSGHFCTSLNFLGDTQAFAAPRWSFRPTGLSAPAWSQAGARFLRYAQLPRETVCTENLTPWLKLLPCKQRAGLAELLNPMKLYATNYHAMTVRARHICGDPSCSSLSLELRQTLTVVFDRRLHNYGETNNWELQNLMRRVVTMACPLASHSRIFVESPRGVFTIHPAPTLVHHLAAHLPDLAEFDVAKVIERGQGLDLSFSYPSGRVSISSAPRFKRSTWDDVPVVAEKYATGNGNVEGGVKTIITNRDPKRHLQLVYFDLVPWYFRIHYRTLSIILNGYSRRPARVFYQPGQDRRRPHHLELLLHLPPSSTLEVSYSFSKALLRWTEYPPDANRGFFIPASSISFIRQPGLSPRQLPVWASSIENLLANRSRFGRSDKEAPLVRLYTVPLLISVPTPDFSMPFNALCLACTVMAIALGTVHNFTTRPVIGVSVNPVKRSLKDRLKSLVGLGKDAETEKEKTE